jgi:hypothetical protein
VTCWAASSAKPPVSVGVISVHEGHPRGGVSRLEHGAPGVKRPTRRTGPAPVVPAFRTQRATDTRSELVCEEPRRVMVVGSWIELARRVSGRQTEEPSWAGCFRCH